MFNRKMGRQGRQGRQDRQTEQIGGAIRETGKQTNRWKRQTKGHSDSQTERWMLTLFDGQTERVALSWWTVRPTSKQIDVRETNR